MKILVACEESQAVTCAMRDLGHEAYSCDLQECSGGHPEWHIRGDALKIISGRCEFETMDGKKHSIGGRWDMLIAHPPCTYLSNAGARWLYAGGMFNESRYQLGLDAKSFFQAFLDADCGKIAVENPVPSKIYKLPPCTQIIQPYEYGHPWSKKTCLWLKNLPKLIPTEIIQEHRPYCSSGSYSKSHDPRYIGASRKGGSAKIRAKTFAGIAKAMAEQWAGETTE